jgi:amino acid adenylation domain-containing protein
MGAFENLYVQESLALHAQNAPGSIAVTGTNGSYTYAQLYGAACNVANRVAPAIDPGRQSVAISMVKSPMAVAALYGVLLSGCCYVPIDPELPRERIDYILQEGKVSCLIVSSKNSRAAESAMALGVDVVVLDETIFSSSAASVALPAVDDESRATILFTSGSTGMPKGAVITHGNLRTFVEWAVTKFAITSEDRLVSHAPLNFDLSFFDLFAPVTAGASVVLMPAEKAGNGQLLLNFIREQRITVWQSVPSALGLIAEAAERDAQGVSPYVRAVLFAGERMPVPRLKKLMNIFPAARHYNIYGCTESNNTFIYDVPLDTNTIPDPLPIGAPLAYVDYKLLDENGKDVVDSAPGILWVAAPTLMEGYLDENATAAVIRVMAGRDGVKRRFYLTKDTVQRNSNDQFEFIGRIDFVIKANGFRINLQEIEDKLSDYGKVDEVGVIALADDVVGNKILALIKPADGESLDSLEMKIYCGKRLPKYMIPNFFQFTTNPLPKNTNGKVDKKALQRSYALQRQSAHTY